MNRASFFKTILGGAAVAVVAPRLLAEESKPDKVMAVDVAKIPKGVSVKEVAETYRNTGELPYYLTGDLLDREALERLYKAYSNGSWFETMDKISIR